MEGTAQIPEVPGDCWSSSVGGLGLSSFILGVSLSSWTVTWTPGSRTQEARLALLHEVQASCPGSWLYALWGPPPPSCLPVGFAGSSSSFQVLCVSPRV